jgi:hypothetical protein
MSRRFLSLAVGAAATAALFAAPAHALRVTESRSIENAFDGVGCGATDAVTVRAPKKAYRVRRVGTPVGTLLYEIDTGEAVARITDVRRVRVSSQRWGIRWTAVATYADHACTNPEAYTEWEGSWLAYKRLKIRYRIKRRVYFSGSNPEFAQRRPRTLYFGANGYMARMRWWSWDGRSALGRGRYPYNDCNPYCAAGQATFYPARVRLYRARRCAGRYRYLRMRIYFLRSVPPHHRRTEESSFGFVCQ